MFVPPQQPQESEEGMAEANQTVTAQDLDVKNPKLAADEEKSTYSYSQRSLYLVMAALVLLVGFVAALISRGQVNVMENEVVAREQNLAQAWVESSLENLNFAIAKVLEPINFMSQAEMFRLFVNDINQVVGDNLAKLNSAEVLENEEHELHSITEELAYLRDLMRDTAKRQGWLNVGLFNHEALEIVSLSSKADVRLNHDLFLQAKEKRRPAFSNIYLHDKQFVVDIVEPLYEVMSNKEPAIVGYLLVTLPVNNILQDILSPAHLQNLAVRPSLLTFAKEGYKAFFLGQDAQIAVIEGEKVAPSKLGFTKRASFVDGGEVFSQGGRLANPLWYVLVEKKVDLVGAEIAAKAQKIYGLGVLGSLTIALTLAIIIGTTIARRNASEGQKCIGGLVHAIECALDGSDPNHYLQGRSAKLGKLALRIGKILNLSNNYQENIRLAARLSQVGKIFVPRDIMVKRGILTEDERRQVQLAPYHAYNVLKGVLPKRVALIVYQMGGKVVDDLVTAANHELKPSEMLVEARVLLVANDFCGMTSQRGNRPPLSLAVAREKLVERSIYDRSVVQALNTLSDAEIKELLNLP